ncbi:MAG: glycosyltransferase family 4 protein [Proteobacteria bacterium]|nr:glycosyltransferase family 4 protein [Pseudomonadota bacterium]
MKPRPRLALLGAFAFPAPQGSQVYAAGQARALADAGAEVELFAYDAGTGPGPPELCLRRTRPGLAPTGFHSGLHPRKLAADAALGACLLEAHRERAFDAVLAHNAEAALVALSLRPRLQIPVVYVAHTLWRYELSAYARLGRASAAIGGALDRWLASRADAVVALTGDAARELGPHARGPLVTLPPGVQPVVADTDEVTEACRRAALRPGGYALYAGNLDAYQDLGVLAALARHAALPIALATHAATAPTTLAGARVLTQIGVREAAALARGAHALLLPRERPGGFPIKLLNYWTAERPVVACADAADGLVHGDNAWLVPARAGAQIWARALEALEDARLRERLVRGGRRALARRHAWPELAHRTLALVEQIRGSHPAPLRAATRVVAL